MHNRKFLFKFYAVLFLFEMVNAIKEDEEIIKTCLERLSNESDQNFSKQLLQLEQYANWTMENIPCFSRCVSEAKGWFNTQSNRWNKQRLVEELGADIYNYCRYELDRAFHNACEFAHRGLKCLKQAETNLGISTAALLGCSMELNVTLDQLRDYVPFQTQEKIPCLFQCFAKKMQLYGENLEWNVQQWEKAFGPSNKNISEYRSQCKFRPIEAKDQTDNCAIIYAEYICIERLGYQSPRQNNNN